jgi:hypothetical protein
MIIIIPTLSQAMDESNIDTFKKMFNDVDKEITQDKTNNRTSFQHNLVFGILCHNISLNGAKSGNRGFAAKCFEHLNTDIADKTFPDSLKPIAVAYRGSARTLMGDEDGNPVNKIKFTNDGIAILNGAVDQYGKVSFIPRFMRANVFFSLPEFFQKETAATKDYVYLEDCFISGSIKPDNGIMSFVYLNRGNLFKKNRDMKQAMVYWKKSISIAPSSHAAQVAAKQIALFSE